MAEPKKEEVTTDLSKLVPLTNVVMELVAGLSVLEIGIVFAGVIGKIGYIAGREGIVPGAGAEKEVVQ